MVPGGVITHFCNFATHVTNEDVEGGGRQEGRQADRTDCIAKTNWNKIGICPQAKQRVCGIGSFNKCDHATARVDVSILEGRRDYILQKT